MSSRIMLSRKEIIKNDNEGVLAFKGRCVKMYALRSQTIRFYRQDIYPVVLKKNDGKMRPIIATGNKFDGVVAVW